MTEIATLIAISNLPMLCLLLWLVFSQRKANTAAIERAEATIEPLTAIVQQQSIAIDVMEMAHKSLKRIHEPKVMKT